MHPRRRCSLFGAMALSWVVLALGCSGGRPGGVATDARLATDGVPDAPVDLSSDPDAGNAGEPRDPDGPGEAADATTDIPNLGADAALDAAQADLTSTMSDACLPSPPDAGGGDGLRRFLDLVVRGQGFEEHEGSRVYVLTRDINSGTPLGHGSDLVRAGQFTVRFPSGYARFSYQSIFYYVDVNGDGRCEESTGDHPGHMLTGAFNPPSNDPREQPVQDNHTSMERNERVCDLMNACH